MVLGYGEYKIFVAGIELGVSLNIHPRDVTGIITCFQWESAHTLAIVIVVVDCLRLHPRVVRVAGVIHVALKQYT